MVSNRRAPSWRRQRARYARGRAACLEFWQNLASNRDGSFTTEDIVAIDERAITLWRYHFGPGQSQSIRGVNVMHVREGLITEALGYVKSGDATVATAVRSATRS